MLDMYVVLPSAQDNHSFKFSLAALNRHHSPAQCDASRICVLQSKILEQPVEDRTSKHGEGEAICGDYLGNELSAQLANLLFSPPRHSSVTLSKLGIPALPWNALGQLWRSSQDNSWL